MHVKQFFIYASGILPIWSHFVSVRMFCSNVEKLNLLKRTPNLTIINSIRSCQKDEEIRRVIVIVSLIRDLVAIIAIVALSALSLLSLSGALMIIPALLGGGLAMSAFALYKSYGVSKLLSIQAPA
jgi:hypothetical protein